MKPSADHVFQKTSRGLGCLVRWVSRSAMWMPLTPTRLHEARPTVPVGGLGLVEIEVEVAREVDQRLLDEPRHHPRIGAAAGDRGGAAGVAGALGPDGLAQGVVGARGVGGGGVEIEAEPRLDDGVDIEDAEFAAQLHQVERGRVDREVDAEAPAFALRQERREQVAVVVLRHGLLDEAHAVPVEHAGFVLARIDDDHPALVEIEVALDQRQRAASDGAEADHHDRAGDLAVNRIVLVCHFSSTPRDGVPFGMASPPSKHRRPGE